MRCPRCQHENPRETGFCDECGTRLEVTCSACGEANRVGAKFCGNCGLSLIQTDRSGSPPVRFDSPHTYTPRHLAEKIRSSRSLLEGERKRVTVLFADMKESMELLAGQDPEEARRILDPVLEQMMDAVHRYEGTVNQVMGDGIMALFGAPISHEDHAVRACFAALRMQESLRAHGVAVAGPGRVAPEIRVGLNSGEVVVRSIGSDLKIDYTAVGMTTHLASRLEQAATPGSILISADTLDLTQGYVVTRPLGRIPVKGLQEPVEAYELIDVGAVRTTLQAAAARGLTRFVGRAGEMAQLEQALALARSGLGQVVSVVGEAGVGKSRVLWEFARSEFARDFTLLEASCLSYGTDTPYLATIELLRSYFHIEPMDDIPATLEKATSTIEGLDRALLSELPALLSVLGVVSDDRQWQELDPLHRRHRILDAIRRVLFQESRRQPLLIVVEDLHWVDSETQIVLDTLVESLPKTRVLLLLSYRPEYHHSWNNRTYYSQLRIDPLRGASAERLLGALLGDDPLLDPLKHRLTAWADGNPFFLEESIRTLVETGALAGYRGSYALAAPITGLEIPGTLQTLLAARIDRLMPEDKYVLQIASVIGTGVPVSALRAVAGLPDQDLQASLGRLQAGEFLYEERLLPEQEYAFRHAVTHDVAYRGLLLGRRREFHLRIAAVMEEAPPDRLSQHVAALAQHLLRGEAWDRAVMFSTQAGIQAVEQGALREAATCFEQALAALRHLPESEGAITTGIDLRFGIRNTLAQYGEVRELLARLEEAREMALRVKDERRHTRAMTYIAEHYFLVGALDRALEYGEQALDSARKLAAPGLLLEATTHLGMICHAIGQYRRSADIVRPNTVPGSVERRKGRFANPALLSNYSRSWLVWNLAELGLFEEAMGTAEEGVREADALEHPFYRVVAKIGLGIATLRQGDWMRARGVLEDAVALSKGGGGFRTLFAAAAGWLGSAYAFGGQLTEASALHHEGIAQAAASGLAVYEAVRQIHLGETLVLSGRIDKALETAHRAVALARERGERGHEAWALRLLGEIVAKDGSVQADRAEAHFRDAMAIAEAHGMRPLIAHCHLGIGQLHWRTGRRQEAYERLGTAMTMYREMDMRYWLQKAEAEASRLR